VEPSFGVDRDTLIGRLSEGGVDCSVHFIPAHHQPYFRQLLGEPDGHFPRAEHVFSQILSLPLYPLLSNEDVDRVCEDIAREARPPGSTMEGIRSSRASEESRAWGIRSLIVGGGDDARRILGELRPFAGLGLQPIGIIDDHRRRRVAGLPILGQRSDLAVVVDAYDVGLVIIADPSLPAKEIRRLGQVASSSGASVRYLPSTTSGGNRVGGIGDLRSLANAPSGTRRIQ
jgi:hypothetical protein